KLHAGPRAELDRELFAQGIGNTLCGLLGALPITGVIVRSKANIDAGARSRFAAVLHGLWVLLFITQLGFLVSRIPAAVLAGLLLIVGAKLVSLPHIRELYAHKEWPVYLITLLGVVGYNLLAGIGLGIAAALLMLVWRLSRLRTAVKKVGEEWL